MRITRRRFIATVLGLIPAAIFLDSLWFEKFFIEINEFFLGNASEKTNNIKLLQISDLHLQEVSAKHTRLANKINSLKPDLIVFTGDSIDKENNLPVLNEFLQLLDPTILKAAILGNWEYWGKVDLVALRKVYDQNNCTLLINESKQYTFGNKTICITGTDDFVGGKADIHTATKNYVSSDHHVILNHCPEYSAIIQTELKEIKADLILSGHTHGGQINIFGYIPFLPQGSGGFVKGWYRDNQPPIYVSKGIGTSKVPARFGARAEVAMFRI
jgi:predicted MPP superfamily phosphohydrolase